MTSPLESPSNDLIRITVYVAASIDGFIARPDGEVDWLHDDAHIDDNEDYGFKAFMDDVDALVMGRKTFEKVLTFSEWPYGDTPVFVLSSNDVAIPDHLPTHVESTSLPPAALAHALAAQGLKHLYIDGGQTIQSFLAEDLVTQLVITRVPRLIGHGIPLFADLDRDILLRHEETKAYPKGLVQSRYSVIRE